MDLQDGLLLRLFIGEADRKEGKPLFHWIVDEAHRRKLAGVTVLRGLEGYGAGSHIHTARVLRLSTDLPLVVEVVDEAAKVEAFMKVLDEAMPGGLITVEKVRMRPSPKPAADS